MSKSCKGIKCSIFVHFNLFSWSAVPPVPDVEDGAVADDPDEPDDGVEQSHGHHRPVAGGSKLGPVAWHHLPNRYACAKPLLRFCLDKKQLEKAATTAELSLTVIYL